MAFELHPLSSKLTNHNLFQDNSRPEGRYYIHPDGSEFVSVTTFLGRLDSGDGIQKWRDAVGHVEAARISKAATDKGTAIHDAAEKLLLNDLSWKDTLPMYYKPDFFPLKKYLESNITSVIGLEHQMYSRRIKLAGTADCIGLLNGKISIIDYKTSSGIKYKSDISSYFLQCACYAIMAYELYSIKVEQLSILMTVEGQPNISVFNEPFSHWGKEIIKLC